MLVSIIAKFLKYVQHVTVRRFMLCDARKGRKEEERQKLKRLGPLPNVLYLICERGLREKKYYNTSQASHEHVRAEVYLCESECTFMLLSGTSAFKEGFLEEVSLVFKRKGKESQRQYTLPHLMGTVFS